LSGPCIRVSGRRSMAPGLVAAPLRRTLQRPVVNTRVPSRPVRHAEWSMRSREVDASEKVRQDEATSLSGKENNSLNSPKRRCPPSVFLQGQAQGSNSSSGTDSALSSSYSRLPSDADIDALERQLMEIVAVTNELERNMTKGSVDDADAGMSGPAPAPDSCVEVTLVPSICTAVEVEGGQANEEEDPESFAPSLASPIALEPFGPASESCGADLSGSEGAGMEDSESQEPSYRSMVETSRVQPYRTPPVLQAVAVTGGSLTARATLTPSRRAFRSPGLDRSAPWFGFGQGPTAIRRLKSSDSAPNSLNSCQGLRGSPSGYTAHVRSDVALATPALASGAGNAGTAHTITRSVTAAPAPHWTRRGASALLPGGASPHVLRATLSPRLQGGSVALRTVQAHRSLSPPSQALRARDHQTLPASTMYRSPSPPWATALGAWTPLEQRPLQRSCPSTMQPVLLTARPWHASPCRTVQRSQSPGCYPHRGPSPDRFRQLPRPPRLIR